MKSIQVREYNDRDKSLKVLRGVDGRDYTDYLYWLKKIGSWAASLPWRNKN